jgi:hypothetical protein
MALETNANIPTPYVYQPADVAGMMKEKFNADLEAQKLKKKEGDERQKRIAQAKGFQFAQSNNPSMQKLLQDEYNAQTDMFAQMASQGADITNISTTEGIAFDQWKRDFTNKALAAKETQAEYDRLMDSYRSNPQNFDLNSISSITDKFTKGETIEDKAEAINYARNNPLAFGKQVDVAKGVETTFDAAFADLDLNELASKTADFTRTLQPKTEEVISNYLLTPEATVAKQQFEFKKSMGASDVSQYNSFEEYVKTLAEEKAKLKTAELTKLRGSMNINIGGGGVGQTAGGATVTPVETGKTTVPINFSSGNIKYEKGKLIIPTDQAAIETPKEWGAFDKIKIKDGKAEVPLEGMWYLDDSTGKNEWNISNFNTSSKQAVSEHKSSFTLPDIDQTPVKNSSIVSLKKTQDGSIWAKLDNGNKILIATPHSELMQKVKDNGVELYRIMYGGKGSLTAGDVNNFWLGKVTPGQDIDFSIDFK